MLPLSTLFFTSFLSFLFSLLITPLIRVLGLKFNIVDKPNDRKIHKKPIVRIGGISIGISFFITILLSFHFKFFEPTFFELLKYILLAVLAMLILGATDDFLSISSFKRLFIQTLIALVAYSSNLGFRININLSDIFAIDIPESFSSSLSLFLTVFWIVAFTNAFNWLDGLDGQSCGYTLITCLGLIPIAITSGNIPSIILILPLFGSCLGFLLFNYYPAKIFMGDGGTYLIGTTLSLIGISTFNSFLINTSTLQSIFIIITIFFLPIYDMTFVILKRIFDGKSPFFPDRSHIHHRLIAEGLTHYETVISFYVLSQWFSAISLFVYFTKYGAIIFSVSTIFLILFLIKKPKLRGFLIFKYFLG